MAQGNAFIAAQLKLFFNGTSVANLADNTATSPATSLFVALHTASPGAGGTQATNEAAYTGYARVAVARTAVGFPQSGQSVDWAADVVFGAPTAGTETETYFSIGTLATGAGMLMHFGPLTPSIAVSPGSAAPKILAAGSSVSLS